MVSYRRRTVPAWASLCLGLSLPLIFGCSEQASPLETGPSASTHEAQSRTRPWGQQVSLDVSASVQRLPGDVSSHETVWLLVELSPDILSASRSDLRDLRVEVEDPARKEPLVIPSIVAEASWIVRNVPRSGSQDLTEKLQPIEVQRLYEPNQVLYQWEDATRRWMALIETRNLPIGTMEVGFSSERVGVGAGVEIPVEVERAVPEAGVSPWDCILRTRVAKPGPPSTAGKPSAVEVSFVVSNINQHRLWLGSIPPELDAAAFRPDVVSLRGPRLLLAFPVHRRDLATCTYSLRYGDRQALSPGFETGLEGESQFLDQLEQACEPRKADDVLQQLGQGLKSPLVPNASLH
ncbi:hypothetical protein Spb1_37400 [Planctopirus ephydatiae]|uniref:Lipoprotein n=1 Tax=Planctopirus ephydatiae TaxID=2528019 RepID=A0A518GT79_9PLAN|nr:hypothetical protein [Planctopirus ephydatiae]QDV31795.1 hypothetical protein Spb1_37400 [Planctopirus ephydatiae]